MKPKSMWRAFVCLASLATVAAPALAAEGQINGTLEGAAAKAVAARENEWLLAERANTPDKVIPLLAERFVSTGSDGVVRNKADEIADLRARKFTSVDYEDVKVVVYGDTAVATGVYRGRGSFASGKAFDEHERWTDTWTRLADGRWVCVAGHDSALPK